MSSALSLLQGWSPLHCAADNGQVAMLSLLLTPSTVNAQNQQVTALKPKMVDMMICMKAYAVSVQQWETACE